MKLKLMLAFASLTRAVPFLNLSAKLLPQGLIKRSRHRKNVTNPILPSVQQQRLSYNSVGIKYLTTAAMGRDVAAETEFAIVKTSVWWDIENCCVPKGCDGHGIALNISSHLWKMNYSGSLTIYAYGDTNKIPSHVQQALSSTGVSLNHVPAGVKDGSDKKIIVDMLLWAMENQAPANIMLVSGDGDFSYVLHKLRMKGYNILLVRPDTTSPFLISAANTIWLWNIVAGSGSKVPTQAEPSKRMDSDLVVESKKSQSFCEICKAAFTSVVDFNSHFSGIKHKNKAAVVASQSANVSDLTRPVKEQPKTLFCSICQVHCPKASHGEHISGRKHKNKL